MPPVTAIRDALTYIARFRGRLLVIKVDDSILESPMARILVQDIVLMRRLGINSVVVAGARNVINRALKRAAISSRYHRGLRVTTDAMMDHVMHAVSVLNTRLMSLFSECGGQAASGNWIQSRSLGIVEGVDYGRSGSVERVDNRLIRALIDREVVPIVSTIGWNTVGTVYNLGSDDLAIAIATTMQAAKLFVVTDAPGIMSPRGSQEQAANPPQRISGAYSTITVEEAVALEDSNSSMDNTTRGLLRMAVAACRSGVERVHVVDGTRDGVLLEEVFSAGGSGTMVYANRFTDFEGAIPEDVASIISLMQPLVAEGLLVARSSQQIIAAIDDWMVYRVDDTIQGCSGLDRLGGKDAEIVGLAVNPPYRAANVGRRLVELLLRRAGDIGMDRVFVLTTQAIDFFQELGFQDADLTALPAVRRSLYNGKRGSRVLMTDLRQAV